LFNIILGWEDTILNLSNYIITSGTFGGPIAVLFFINYS
jgi:hypothetical protein